LASGRKGHSPGARGHLKNRSQRLRGNTGRRRFADQAGGELRKSRSASCLPDSTAKSVTASVYLWFGRMLSNLADLPTPGPNSKSTRRRSLQEAVDRFRRRALDTNKRTWASSTAKSPGGLDRQKRPRRESEVVFGKGYQSLRVQKQAARPSVQLREKGCSLSPHN